MISILLAVYNGEKYISQSIDSIINQTFKDWELLIGFNGTTDSSKDIVNSYDDHRIKVFDYKNDKGKAKTLNKLIKKASYDWCATQDDDDIWLPQKLEKQICLTNEYDCIGTFCKYINENNQITGQPSIASGNDDIIRLSLGGVNQIISCSAIFKKDLRIEWNESLDGLIDYDYWLKLIKKEYKFYNIPDYLVLHRLHQESNFNTKSFNINQILSCI
jgi:glycosyltransferase involved in cell wall biosynthesis